MSSYYTYKNGIKDSVPIALGYLAVSFAFGVSVVGQGLNPLFALFMSASNLTSAGQFAGTAVILAFGSIFEVVLTQLVINARYLLMSLTLSQKLDAKWTFIDRLLCSFGITDEIFAVAVSHRGQVGKKYVYGLILLPFLSWSSGTILGALAGNLLPSIILNSLNIALYAMFIAIVIPAGMVDKRLFIVVGVSIALSCIFYYVPFFNSVSSGIAYIICAVVAGVFGALVFPIKTTEDNLDKGDESLNKEENGTHTSDTIKTPPSDTVKQLTSDTTDERTNNNLSSQSKNFSTTPFSHNKGDIANGSAKLKEEKDG